MQPRDAIIAHIDIARAHIEQNRAGLAINSHEAQGRFAIAHLRRVALVVVLELISRPAPATTAFLYRNPASVIVGADSHLRSGFDGARMPDKCKIHRCGRIYFLAVGMDDYTAISPDGSMVSFDVAAIPAATCDAPTTFVESSRSVESNILDRRRPVARLAREIDPDYCKHQGNDTTLVFFWVDESGVATVVSDTIHVSTDCVVTLSPDGSCPGTLCPPPHDRPFILPLGWHNAIAEYIQTNLEREAFKPGSETDLVRQEASFIDRMITLQAHATPDHVATPVDIIRLESHAACWAQHKDSCDRSIPDCPVEQRAATPAPREPALAPPPLRH